MCAPYFLNLNNNSFQLKMLLFFVHLRLQQKRTESHLPLSNIQCCHFDIVILRVAIISNVQNVRLQRRHRRTDDASPRRRRGLQQTGPVRTMHTVRCAHKSGDVINFIIIACRISSWLKWSKNYKNRIRLAKVMVKNKMSRFLWSTMYMTSQFAVTAIGVTKVVAPAPSQLSF